MRIIKSLAAGLAAIMLLSSCSVLKNVTSNASGTGINTGTALASLYQILMSSGSLDLSKLDLGDLTNIINIGKVLTGANALTDATQEYTTDFASGLIKGSAQLINNSNVQAVLDALKSLSKVDSSALAQAAAAAAAGTATQVSTSTAGVSQTLASLGSILKAMK